MIKRSIFLFFLFPALVGANQFTTELRVGYFYPTSSLVRSIYKSGGVEYEIESSVPLYKELSLWGNFNYFHRTGTSTGLSYNTSINMYPLSLGLKYAFPITKRFDVYLGLGGSYSWVAIHNHSPYVTQHIHSGAWGGVAKSGLVYFFNKRFFLDVFLDYYYTNLPPTRGSGVESHSQNIGGLRSGAGLGVCY